ncbi:hypothetical protein NX794_26720 [Streptomyces sp. LP11]|uniref:Uncharacterized protein n=1 Tax=Streptomyces pyxinicus TaxID=2970331 RepID=A0ABT2B8D4_9ACTN|nr:hypothetical protein [Streptomyces sp. LP11]MCS0604782.1 hypothetical protein [Streptomyces sp. LP11]
MPHPHTQEAEAHLAELRAALAAHGVTLPSLGLELPSLTSSYAAPLIALGNCNLETAAALTAALRKGAAG